MRQLVDAGYVQVDGQRLPLRSVRAGVGRYRAGERKVREDDIEAVRKAIDAALK